MSYSIKPILKSYTDKDGLSKVEILIVYKRMKAYIPTIVKVLPIHFNAGKIVTHKNKVMLNAVLQKQITDIETKLLDALRQGDIDKNQLSALSKKNKSIRTSDRVSDFVTELQIQLKGKISDGRLKHYEVMGNKLNAYDSKLRFRDITLTRLNDFESYLRKTGIEINTLNSNMSILRAVLNRAEEAKLIDKSQFERYKVPKYQQKLIEYLTEEEIAEFANMVATVKRESYKLAGNYFLLSCYTGYRISDAKRFDYEQMVRDETIVLQANKNKKIVSIPIHSRLKTVLQFVKKNPLSISEEKTREYVKDICALAGIKKHVKFHTSRHSFAMLLMKKGFSLDETAHLLGDTLAVARVYAHIHDETLNQKVLDRLG